MAEEGLGLEVWGNGERDMGVDNSSRKIGCDGNKGNVRSRDGFGCAWFCFWTGEYLKVWRKESSWVRGWTLHREKREPILWIIETAGVEEI